jgi:DnaK suppressor protein
VDRANPSLTLKQNPLPYNGSLVAEARFKAKSYIIQGETMRKKKSNTSRATAVRNRPKAASEDVLNRPMNSRLRINPKWERNYRRLTELRDHFLDKKGSLTRDANEEQPSYSEHMADAGTDSYDRDFALSMLSSDQNALYEIDEAIRRIESGTYGKCELTGKPIQLNRLNAIPWTRFSLEAEHQLEQRGVVNRTRLGNLGSVTEGEEGEEEETESRERENPQE